MPYLTTEFRTLLQRLHEAERASRSAMTRSIYQSRLAERMQRHFIQQRRALLKALRAGQREADTPVLVYDADIFPTLESWLTFLEASGVDTTGLVDDMSTIISDTLQLGGDDVVTLADDADISFDLANPRAVAYLEKQTLETIQGIEGTTRLRIRSVLRAAIETGQSYSDAAAQLQDALAADTPRRASLIATTEIGNAYAEGNLQGAKQLTAQGLTMLKRWLTSGDNKVSDGCKANAAAGWIAFDAAFPSGDQRPLRFPGCRCDVEVKADV